MKIETQFQDDHQVKIKVEVEAEQLEEAKQRAARKLAKKVKIPGFRPGKAPMPVIVRQLGEGAIIEEALDILVDELYPKVIQEAGIRPYGPGTLEGVPSLDPAVLEFTVPLEAQVTLGDYHSLEKSYELPSVSEADVDGVIENLRQRQAVLEPTDRPAEPGDMVTVKLSAMRKDPAPDQEPTLIKERSFPILIREPEAVASGEQHYEWPFSGFSQHLTGMSANEEKTLAYTYAEDALQEGFRGVTAEFNLVVESVKSRILPEVNDDFARSLGEYEDMSAVRLEVRKMLEDQARTSYDEQYSDELLDDAIQLAEFKYPPQMLERELDEVMHNLSHRLEQQNMTMEVYLKSRQMDEAALRQEARPVAESQLKKNLFLMELANAENLQITQQEILEETQNTVNMLASSMPEKDAKRLGDRQVYSNIVNNVMAELITRRSMQRLRDIASGKLDEILAAEAAAAEIVAEEAPEPVLEAQPAEGVEAGVPVSPQVDEEA